jgi:hypothetical protein
MLMAEPMAPGTRILADVNAIHLPAPPPTVAEAIPIDVALRLKRNWPALQEVIDVLRSIDPAAAQKFIATAVPQSGPKLAAGALLFLAALRGGSVENWLGAEPLRLLAKAGRADLARRLGDDFTQAAQLASDPTKGDWRVLLLPIYDGEAMRQVTFFFRHGGKSPGRGSERDTGTRFVVDLDLDATGALQFDGLVRKHQFDLIMRSVRPLAEEWRRDIATIFGDALAISGMKGGVTFQVGAARQTPLDDMRRNASHGTVTV